MFVKIFFHIGFVLTRFAPKFGRDFLGQIFRHRCINIQRKNPSKLFLLCKFLVSNNFFLYFFGMLDAVVDAHLDRFDRVMNSDIENRKPGEKYNEE